MAEEQTLDRKFPDVVPGAVVRVHQEITDVNPKGEEKKRVQVFEGTVLARKHGAGIKATITVRKVSEGIGVEKIFPLELPTIKKIETVKKLRVNRAKLAFLRKPHKKIKDAK
jgi:large subunit ribosomal protein L19